MIFSILFGLGILSITPSGQSLQQASKQDSAVAHDTTRFEQVWVYGLQGRVADGLVFLDSLEESSLTPRQSELRKKFYARFRTFDEHFHHKSDDTAVVHLTEMYHTYWRQSLLDNAGIHRYDSMLADSISIYLRANDPGLREKSLHVIRDDFPSYLSDFFHRQGVFSAVGKTGQFFDLLLHTKETEATYHVNTPETTVQVKVVFMENMISNGWEEYATFGKYFPGGWTTDEALYCARESYDTSSENFKISYLQHEGNHFADYKRFPKLTGTDLEYRAKLVELSVAQTSLFDLIGIFSRNSSTDRNNPHAFANHCVIRDMGQTCGITGDVDDVAAWRRIPVATINQCAAQLLKRSSMELTKAGADTVQTILK